MLKLFYSTFDSHDSGKVLLVGVVCLSSAHSFFQLIYSLTRELCAIVNDNRREHRIIIKLYAYNFEIGKSFLHMVPSYFRRTRPDHINLFTNPWFLALADCFIPAVLVGCGGRWRNHVSIRGKIIWFVSIDDQKLE